MNLNEDRVRAGIAEQASDWFLANEEGPLDARDSAALAAWLRASPVHIEEFLAVSAIARDLTAAGADPEYSLEAILARVRAEGDPAVHPLWSRTMGAVRDRPSRRWFAAVATAACVVVSLGSLLLWNGRQGEHLTTTEVVTTAHFETRHGEQLTRVLADNSVLHLNTDSAVTVRYGKNERRVVLLSGQAAFEVAHEAGRAFRVIAGATEVIDLGTQFDVRLEHDATVITVVAGRVAVAPIQRPDGTGADSAQIRPSMPLGAGQRIRVSEGEWPAVPISVDAQRATDWLRREIVFDHEPLGSVAAEYNRYSSKPIEIATPALRGLQVSGVFATDDTEAFVAFLRSLKGVRVEVADSRIRVSRD
jgi:transmembrane sensor